jgi:hypothetical protein
VTSVNAHYYSVLTTPFDMVNAHYVIIDFRAKFSLRFKIRQVTQVARFRLSLALPSCYARSLASDLGKSTPRPNVSMHVILEIYRRFCLVIAG